MLPLIVHGGTLPPSLSYAPPSLYNLPMQLVRGLERSGVTGEKKDQLVALADKVRQVLGSLRIEDNDMLLRRPPEHTTREAILARRMPNIPSVHAWNTDLSRLRPHLPAVSEAVIVDHLSSTESTSTMSRRYYRGMRRVLDLGSVKGLWGIPCPRSGGILWLRFR